jgi:hypothetical protein
MQDRQQDAHGVHCGRLRRIANAQAGDVKRLCARGVLSAAGVKAESCQVAAPPPVWFVFSGTRPDMSHLAMQRMRCAQQTSLLGTGTVKQA